jgi:hypothetical protein
MLACQQGGFRLGVMQVVGCGEVHNVNLGVRQHFSERVISVRDAKFRGFLSCLFPGVPNQPAHVNAIAAQTLDVRGPDEARPGDANADGLFGELFGHKNFSFGDPTGFQNQS